MPSQPARPDRRGGHAPAPETRDRPEQNIGYDEAAKGAPLTADERHEAITDSPLIDADGGDADERDDRTTKRVDVLFSTT